MNAETTSIQLKSLIKRVPLLGSLIASARGQELLETARMARGVRRPLRFIVLEQAGPRSAAHRLRDSGMTIFLRHKTRDVYIFKEVFGGGSEQTSYEPPGQVAAALDRAAGAKLMDVGGNIGLFGVYASSRWPGAKIRSFEPDPTNLPIISRVIAANDLGDSWSVVPVAVANGEADLRFVSGLFAESQLAGIPEKSARHPHAALLDHGETITVHAVDLFEQDHDVDLLKMDIEGGEWSILTDPRLPTLKAGAIVLEWHATGCPTDDPRGATIEALRSAGYVHIEETEDFGYRGLLWAWRDGESA